MLRDQEAHSRRQAGSGVAASRRVGAADLRARDGSPSSVPALRCARRAGAMGTDTFAVHARVRGRGASASSRPHPSPASADNLACTGRA
jgi:hypothetical protein